MATTLGNIVTLINDRRRDATSNSIDMTQDGFRAINSTLQLWAQQHDWPWTLKEYSFNYNAGISTYALPSDFKFPVTVKGKKDRRPEYILLSPYKFESDTIHSKKWACGVYDGVQKMRLKAPGQQISVNTATEVAGNGTYVASGAISNLYNDQYEYFTLPGSIGFSYNGTTGALTNSTQEPVDLTPVQNRGNFYFYVYFPTVSNFSSITFKVGSSASDYYSTTIITDYLGNAPTVGWNTFQANFANPVGAVDITNITYTQVTINFGSLTTSEGFRFQNIFASINEPMILTYYTINMVNDLSGGVQLPIFNDASATTDTTMWSGQWDHVTETFINCVMEIIFWMTGEYTDKALAEKKIFDLTASLRARYPSQRRYNSLMFTTDTNGGVYDRARGPGYQNYFTT